ncbi:MAG TPA: S-adenosylmethionine:tRNA ribosyltransferase-isomerase [Lapillicoccus sp.]|nr:S-adenosylmethionine:tRNA ribosyltransferase-isomerase [Lapillicoccus sp.]
MTVLTVTPTTRFPSPDAVTAVGPPESRGIPRDGVRLLVGQPDRIDHVHFREIARFLRRGDVLVVNTSGTVARQLDAWSPPHGDLVAHLATPLDDGSWVVELRSSPAATTPVLDGRTGEEVHLGEGVVATLADAYPAEGSPTGVGNRLWRASIAGDVAGLLRRAGRPIAYGYLDRRYPLRDYQTVFSRDPGSAEMPSAGRPFTNRLVTRLVRSGILVAPVLLHCGVSSQDVGEAPQPERFEVTADTAALVNAARSRGGRVVAVGTTATRAIESATDADGVVEAASGWTELVIGPDRPVRVVDGLVTGWHNPEASHLLLVEAVAGAELTQRAYDAAVEQGYAWHEFGDSALLLSR